MIKEGNFRSVKTATEIAKLLKDSGVSLEKAEIKLQLADLISALADARIQTAEIQSIVANKDEKIRQLEDALETKNNVTYEKPYYWVDRKGERDGPYCQHCFDRDRKLIRLQMEHKGHWHCRACNNEYFDSSYVAPTGLA